MYKDDNDSVLVQLKHLYRKIVNRMICLRIKTYRNDYHEPPVISPLNLLNECINHMCEKYSADNPVEYSPDSSIHEHSYAQTTPNSSTDSYTGLSSYFHQHFPTSSQPRSLAETLRHSSWQHINMALNYARHGKREGARLHADLAQNAIQMVNQYMSNEEYQAFELELSTRLEDLAREVSG